MKMRIFACVTALMITLSGTCAAADVVTEFVNEAEDEFLETTGGVANELANLETTDGVANEMGTFQNQDYGIALLSEYESGIIITSPASTITTAGGTLQLTATISNPEEDESVIWSIESGANYATITQSGLVTAVANGTVVCKVRSTKDASKVAYKTIIISIQSETKKTSISLMGTKCAIWRTVDGQDIKLGSMHQSSYNVGTEFILKAVPKSGSEFVYWKDGNGKIISYDPEITVNLGNAPISLTATCASSSTAYVTFKDISEKILVAGAVTSEIKVPANPFALGYKFQCWVYNGNMYNFTPRSVLDVSNLTGIVMYSAGYTKDSTEYTVTVTGATSAGGKYKYNHLMVLTPEEPEEGKRFAYWKRDGKIVSYDETYKFYVGAYDTEVEAVFVGINEAVAVVPIIVMSEPQVVETNMLSFVAERNLPEQYTLIGTGIILSNSSSNITLETSGILHSAAKSTANKGQYTVRKVDVSASDVWYARAYMTYRDGSNLITIYSDPVSGSLNK